MHRCRDDGHAAVSWTLGRSMSMGSRSPSWLLLMVVAHTRGIASASEAIMESAEMSPTESALWIRAAQSADTSPDGRRSTRFACLPPDRDSRDFICAIFELNDCLSYRDRTRLASARRAVDESAKGE